MTPQGDVWSEWLLHHRHGDDPEYQSQIRTIVEGFADHVLDDARLRPGMTLVDVGTGEGLLALRAIERVGADLRVILTDISAPLLRHAELEATRRNVHRQCTFLECPADKLTGIGDCTVDCVVTRSSIAYVADKKAVFREFHRILKPGGCISLAEPVLQDEAFAARALRRRVNQLCGQPQDLFLTLLHRWKAAQFPDSEEAFANCAHVNYSERDLLNWARTTGFSHIHMQLHIDVMPSPITSWGVFLGTSPHPLAPTLATIMAAQFTPEERRLFETLVRPTVESGRNETIERMVYLNAVKPPALPTP